MIERGTSSESQEKLRSWLASILLQQGDKVLPRFVRLHAQLARRPLGWRRRLQRKVAVTVTGAALLLALAGFGAGTRYAARADTEATIIVVNGEVKIANNGKCSLIEAIRNANNQNTGQPHADCTAGDPTGADTIVLPKDGVFTLMEANNTSDEYGPNGLPWIGSAMTIEGNGATIRRKEDGPNFRILAVGPQGNITIKNSKISNGRLYNDSWMKDYQGGGVFNQGQLTIVGSEITDHYTYSYSPCGGGIANYGKLTITNSVIKDNTSSGVRSADGGGICDHWQADLEVHDSIISGNSTSAWRYYGVAVGGGIFDPGGTLVITNSLFQNNIASNDYFASGGGVFVASDGTVIGSTFTGNKVSTDGYEGYIGYGAGITNGGNLTITNSTFSFNEATKGGGAIANFRKLMILNSTIVSNAGSGVLSSCKYELNETNIQRSIISGNEGFEIELSDITYCDGFGGIIADKHNIFGHNNNSGVVGFSPGPSDIIPSVPLNAIIRSLADNGGPTWTHALPPGSPAIDRALNNACTAAPIGGVDQRGYPRNRNGAGGTSPNECDIGAFEFQPVEPPTASPTATPTATMTATPTMTVTPTATMTLTATHTSTIEPTVEPTPTTTATTGPSPTPDTTSELVFMPLAVRP